MNLEKRNFSTAPLPICHSYLSLVLNCNKAEGRHRNSAETDRRRKGKKTGIMWQNLLQPDLLCWNPVGPVKRKKINKKITPDGNKLAGGVRAEPESLKADLASKWLNLAFVEARKRSRSLAHNLPQWKSIGSFRTRGLIKRARFFSFFLVVCLDDAVAQKSLSSAQTAHRGLNCRNPFWPHTSSPISSFLILKIVGVRWQSAVIAQRWKLYGRVWFLPGTKPNYLSRPVPPQ